MGHTARKEARRPAPVGSPRLSCVRRHRRPDAADDAERADVALTQGPMALPRDLERLQT